MSDHEPRAPSDDPGVAEVNEALNALPELAAPDRLWDDVRRRIDAAPAKRSRRGFAPVAVAASVLLAAALGVLLAIGPTDRATAPPPVVTRGSL